MHDDIFITIAPVPKNCSSDKQCPPALLCRTIKHNEQTQVGTKPCCKDSERFFMDRLCVHGVSREKNVGKTMCAGPQQAIACQ